MIILHRLSGKSLSGKSAGSERIELKYVASAQAYAELTGWLKVHEYGFSRPYPPRRINNVYFDQHDFASYVHSNEGESFRAKVRYRWYGESDLPGPGQLEVKFRRNHVGWKEIFPVSHIGNSVSSWSELTGRIRAGLSAEGRWWLNQYGVPVLLNRYQRDYWLSRDQRLRVTIDREQVVYDQRSSSRINLNRKIDERHLLVLEVKGLAEDTDVMSGFAARLPLRRSRHSKYCSAVEVITGS